MYKGPDPIGKMEIPVEYWEVPDGTTAISEWLTANSTASVASDAGRATEQIVQTIGGFGRVSDLAKRGIIETLDKMSRRPITHSAHHQKFEIKSRRQWRAISGATEVSRLYPSFPNGVST